MKEYAPDTCRLHGLFIFFEDLKKVLISILSPH